MAKSYFEMFPKILYDVEGEGNYKTATDILKRIRTKVDSTSQRAMYYQYTLTDADSPEILAYNIYGSTQYHWVILLLNKITDPQFEFPFSQKEFVDVLIKKYGSVSRSKGASATITAVEPSLVYSNTVYTVETTSTTISTIFFAGDDAFVKVPASWYTTLETNHQAAYAVHQTITKIEDTASNQGRIWTDHNSSANTIAWSVSSLLTDTPIINTNIHHWEKDVYLSANTTVPIVSGLEIDYRAYANTGLIDSSKKEVSNYDYELDKNEAKRNILLLNPEFLAVFLKEFEFLMKV